MGTGKGNGRAWGIGFVIIYLSSTVQSCILMDLLQIQPNTLNLLILFVGFEEIGN